MVQKIFQGGFDTLNCLEGGRGGGVGGGDFQQAEPLISKDSEETKH